MLSTITDDFNKVDDARNNFMKNHEKRMKELNDALDRLDMNNSEYEDIHKSNQAALNEINAILDTI